MTNEELQEAINCCLRYLTQEITCRDIAVVTLEHLEYLLQEQRCRLGELK